MNELHQKEIHKADINEVLRCLSERLQGRRRPDLLLMSAYGGSQRVKHMRGRLDFENGARIERRGIPVDPPPPGWTMRVIPWWEHKVCL